MVLDEVAKIFNELKNESSRTGKESILEKNKDNKVFRSILRFVYNPYIVTGISTKKMKKKVKIKDESKINVPFSINGVMQYLKENNTGTDIDIYVMQKAVESCGSDMVKELVTQIITKDLKIGITSKTINKIYGEGEIPSFDVMLAESYDKKEKNLKGDFYVTQKLDGNRAVAVKEDGTIKFFTRKGIEIQGLNELRKEFERLPDNHVFDGEILLRNEKNLSSDDLFRETQKVIKKDGDKKDLEFYIFDMLPVSEFRSGKSKKKYFQRRNTMELIEDSEFIKVLPSLYNGSDKSVLPSLMEFAERNGWEGLMVNSSDGYYQSKRTSDLLKVKKFKTAEGVILGVYEGEGKNKGRLGGVLITYKDLAVRIGSGFTDAEREFYWNHQEEIIGKVAEYSYFEESQNQNGGLDLRFATWKRRFREDKTKDDVNYE